MGYSHYWSGKANLDAQTIADIKSIIYNSDVVIAGWDGTGTPRLDETEIRLNGWDAANEAFETFNVTKTGEGGFCKTGRRPYDEVVGAILLRLADLNDEFSVASDGVFDSDDWAAPRALYAKTFGKSADYVVN